jgi:hypothetical protein
VLLGHIHARDAYLSMGDGEAAEREFATIREKAGALRLKWPLLIDSMRAISRGRYAKARSLIAEAKVEGLPSLTPGSRRALFEFTPLAQINQIESETPGPSKTLPLLEKYVEDHPDRMLMRCALACAYYFEGRCDDCRKQLEILDKIGPQRIYGGTSPFLLSSMTLLSGWVQPPDRAEETLALLAPLEDRVVVVPPGRLCLGSICEVLGILAFQLRRW